VSANRPHHVNAFGAFGAFGAFDGNGKGIRVPDLDSNLRRDMANPRTNRSWALFFAREVLGFIFFMAGVYKVFTLGPAGHARKWFLPYSDTFLPVWSLWAVGVTIPFVELIAGGLLILGFRIRESLISLGMVLIIVTFGHLLKEPLYPFHEHVIPRLALLLFCLMLPAAEDVFSLDYLISRLRNPQPVAKAAGTEDKEA